MSNTPSARFKTCRPRRPHGLRQYSVFTPSNTGIVGSNPTRSIYLCVFPVFVLRPCRSQWPRCQRHEMSFVRSNTGIVGSNLTQGMDTCLRLFCVCLGRGLATGWSPVQGVLPNVQRLRNWSETKRFTDALCSKVGATWKRERERVAAKGVLPTV
jgi:hypothetical protein